MISTDPAQVLAELTGTYAHFVHQPIANLLFVLAPVAGGAADEQHERSRRNGEIDRQRRLCEARVRDRQGVRGAASRAQGRNRSVRRQAEGA